MKNKLPEFPIPPHTQPNENVNGTVNNVYRENCGIVSRSWSRRWFWILLKEYETENIHIFVRNKQKESKSDRKKSWKNLKWVLIDIFSWASNF